MAYIVAPDIYAAWTVGEQLLHADKVTQSELKVSWCIEGLPILDWHG